MLRGDATGFDGLAPMGDVRVSEAQYLRDGEDLESLTEP
jgi:hypothetical protein